MGIRFYVPILPIYSWIEISTTRGDTYPEGVLHAKAVVVGDEIAFVTAANLTEAAPDRNIELELLVRNRTLATMARTFEHGTAMSHTEVQNWMAG